MPKNLSTPFQREHQQAYGLTVTERDPVSGVIVSVRCNFCFIFGKEEKAGQKRSRTNNTKYFRHPFRVDNYKSHLTSQHTEVWNSYKNLSPEQHSSFFTDKEPFNNTLNAHFTGEKHIRFVNNYHFGLI